VEAAGGLGHFWSLSIEEHFYLMWPLVVLFASDRWLVRICLGMIGFSLVARIAWWGATHDVTALYVLTWLRLDGLAIGSLMAVVLHTGAEATWAPRLRRAAPVALAICLGIAVFRRNFNEHDPIVLLAGLTPLAVLCAAIVWTAVQRPPSTLTSTWLRLFGRYAYGLYVYHMIVYLALVRFDLEPVRLVARFGVPLWLAIIAFSVVGVAVSFGVAAASYELVEKRILWLKRFFSDNRQRLKRELAPQT
jgi:peptidoglycan/LPS O-acetylase OafA/YrhL